MVPCLLDSSRKTGSHFLDSSFSTFGNQSASQESKKTIPFPTPGLIGIFLVGVPGVQEKDLLIGLQPWNQHVKIGKEK